MVQQIEADWTLEVLLPDWKLEVLLLLLLLLVPYWYWNRRHRHPARSWWRSIPFLGILGIMVRRGRGDGGDLRAVVGVMAPFDAIIRRAADRLGPDAGGSRTSCRSPRLACRYVCGPPLGRRWASLLRGQDAKDMQRCYCCAFVLFALAFLFPGRVTADLQIGTTSEDRDHV